MITSNSKPRKKQLITLLLFLILLSVGVLIYRNTPPALFVAGIIQNMFSAPKSILYSLGKNTTDVKVKELTNKNLKLTEKLANYELLKKDNDALKSQFLISGETSQSLVAAKIVGFQGNSKYPQEFVINVGKKDKVVKGMTVVFQKYLVGKIVEVSNNYSVAITPMSEKFKALAKLPSTNANGLLIGKNDFLLLEGVVITDSLKKDELVTTKGEVDRNGIGILPDIIIGKVSSVSKSETAPFQSAQVIPIIDFSKLTNVFVISQM